MHNKNKDKHRTPKTNGKHSKQQINYRTTTPERKAAQATGRGGLNA